MLKQPRVNARWLEETQGRTSKIFFMLFEQGATLSNVVNQVGGRFGVIARSIPQPSSCGYPVHEFM
jgi:hypothetical protein